MQVPHNSVVLVADGRKILFFRNEGDADFPNLSVEEKEDHPDSRASRPGDRPRRAAPRAPVAGVSATMEEVDFHQQEEDRFAAETAAMLKERALRNEFDALVVVAPPRNARRAAQTLSQGGREAPGRRIAQGSGQRAGAGDREDPPGGLSPPGRAKEKAPQVVRRGLTCFAEKLVQASAACFLPSRLRATRVAAAAPNSRIIGGAGTCVPPVEPEEPWLELPWPWLEPPQDDEPWLELP